MVPGATAEWIAEAGQVADASPVLAPVAVPVHKYDAFVPYSVEIAEDGARFEQEITAILADTVDQLHASAFATGSGVGQPTGIITALIGTSSIVTGTTMTSAEVVSV